MPQHPPSNYRSLCKHTIPHNYYFFSHQHMQRNKNIYAVFFQEDCFRWRTQDSTCFSCWSFLLPKAPSLSVAGDNLPAVGMETAGVKASTPGRASLVFTAEGPSVRAFNRACVQILTKSELPTEAQQAQALAAGNRFRMSSQAGFVQISFPDWIPPGSLLGCPAAILARCRGELLFPGVAHVCQNVWLYEQRFLFF